MSVPSSYKVIHHNSLGRGYGILIFVTYNFKKVYALNVNDIIVPGQVRYKGIVDILIYSVYLPHSKQRVVAALRDIGTHITRYNFQYKKINFCG